MECCKPKQEDLSDVKAAADYEEHKMTQVAMARKLDTDLKLGLTEAEALTRLQRDGYNRLTPPKQTPEWVKFLEEMTGFFSLLLWAGSVLCFIGYALKEEADNLYLGIVLALVTFATGCFSYYQNSKSENLMKSFKNMMPPKVKVIRNNGGDIVMKEIDASEIVVGDVVKVIGGDLIPADLRIISCSDNMCVDNASLTGESEPQKRGPDCTDDAVLETANLAFFGTQVPEGEATGVIISTGDGTVMGRIAKLTMSTSAEQTPINKEIENFVSIISGIAFVLGITFFFIGMNMGTDPITNLVFMIGIIVANVPEGLLATVTVCLTLTANRMATKMVLVKQLAGVETLGSTSCICSDKTGTLTQNIMTVVEVVYAGKDKSTIRECGTPYSNNRYDCEEDNVAFQKLARCGALCNVCFFDEDSKFEETDGGKKVPVPFKSQKQQGDGSMIETINWEPKGNASEGAMVKFVQPIRDIDEWRNKNPDVFKIPFNSANKYQVHIHQQEEYANPDGSNSGARVMLMKGAPERVLKRCTKVQVGNKVVDLSEEERANIVALQEKLSSNGLRILGMAEYELPTGEYPASFDDKYNDGKSAKSTPNFPLGEEAFVQERAAKMTKWRADLQAASGDKETYEEIKAHEPPSVSEKSKPGLVFLGLMALIDPPRPAVPGAVGKCKTAGIKVIMVTGDHPTTAEAIAYKVGILWSITRSGCARFNKANSLSPGDAAWKDPDDAEAIVMPGWDVPDPDATTYKKEDGTIAPVSEFWNFVLEHPQIVFARTSPQQKLQIVENCQLLGHIVAVTGDGVNDSPALKQAHIGVAMGIMGSEVSKNAADMILMDDNFASIVAGVEEGRLIFDNLKKSICYTLTSNIPEISPFLCYITLATPLPLSTILILGIDLGTDMVPAISMAYEDAEADIMRRPPRNSAVDRLVTKKLIFFAYLQIGIMQAMAGFYTWMVVLNDYGYPPHILRGLGKGDYWSKQPLHCQFVGGQYVAESGAIDQSRNPEVDMPSADYPFWDSGDGGYVKNCEFPVKNFRGKAGSPKGFKKDDSSKYTTKTEGTNHITVEAIEAMISEKYFEYLPWKGRMSPYWTSKWLSFNGDRSEAPGGALGKASALTYFNFQPIGLWSLCLASQSAADLKKAQTSDGTNAYPQAVDKSKNFDLSQSTACRNFLSDEFEMKDRLYNKALFCNGSPKDDAACSVLDGHPYQVKYCKKSDTCSADCAVPGADDATVQCVNIASRMMQKEALHHAQSSYFVTIVVVQWADLLICKTRWLSITTQGIRNTTLNFGLFFETLLAAWLCYCPAINKGLGTRNMRFVHWLPGLPWSMLIFMYDEARKAMMRATSPETVDAGTGQVYRKAGWLERNTYY
jgi:sodium/potassium-transporting ATPase subunit alpha